MMVGAGVVVLATLFLLLVHRSQPNRYPIGLEGCRPRLADSLVYGVRHLGGYTRFLSDLLHLRPAGSYYRVCGFKCSKRDPAILGRGVLAMIYMTATPNSIVLGIDPQSSRMLFHQLERASVPKMARALGAQS